MNTDAAFKESRAGVAYVSFALGERVAVVTAAHSIEAEFCAMVRAMYDAQEALPCCPAIVCRTDCTSVANFAVVRTRSLKPMLAEITNIVRKRPQWSVERVKRTGNEEARRLSRRALNAGCAGEDAQREALVGQHD